MHVLGGGGVWEEKCSEMFYLHYGWLSRPQFFLFRIPLEGLAKFCIAVLMLRSLCEWDYNFAEPTDPEPSSMRRDIERRRGKDPNTSLGKDLQAGEIFFICCISWTVHGE